MKIELEEQVFQPIVINLTIETKKEFKDLKELTGNLSTAYLATNKSELFDISDKLLKIYNILDDYES